MVASATRMPSGNFNDPRLYAFTHNDRGLPDGVIVVGAAPVIVARISLPQAAAAALLGGGGLSMRIDASIVAQDQAVEANRFSGRRAAVLTSSVPTGTDIVQEAAVYIDPGATGWVMDLVDMGADGIGLQFTGAAGDTAKVFGLIQALVMSRAGVP